MERHVSKLNALILGGGRGREREEEGEGEGEREGVKGRGSE